MGKKILIVGGRGIANYGGFESYIAALAPRLASRGYDVACSCEKSKTNPEEYRGVHLEYFPLKPPSRASLRTLFEPVYDLYFILKSDYDVVYGVGCLGGFFYGFPRLLGKKSIVNIAGLEWRRGRFGRLEKMLIRLLWISCTISASKIAIDNRQLKAYINPALRGKVVYTSYDIGESAPSFSSWEETPLFGRVEPGQYWLQVARIEPDNRAAVTLEAFAMSKTKKKFVMIGNFTVGRYKDNVNEIIERYHLQDRIVFMKPIYDRPIFNTIRKNCFAYLHGHSVGGTNPSLLEIMSLAVVTLASDVAFNREVGGDTLLYFKDSKELASAMDRIESDPRLAEDLADRARDRVRELYSWDSVAGDYFQPFQ